MSVKKTLAAKQTTTQAEKDAQRIARNLALASRENAQLGLPEPWWFNGFWLVPLTSDARGRCKPITRVPWRRPKK